MLSWLYQYQSNRFVYVEIKNIILRRATPFPYNDVLGKYYFQMGGDISLRYIQRATEFFQAEIHAIFLIINYFYRILHVFFHKERLVFFLSPS